MAFVDGSNVVRLVIERPSDKVEPVDYEAFDFILAKGVYTVYAFANIPRSTSGLDFTVGNQAPTFQQPHGALSAFQAMIYL